MKFGQQESYQPGEHVVLKNCVCTHFRAGVKNQYPRVFRVGALTEKPNNKGVVEPCYTIRGLVGNTPFDGFVSQLKPATVAQLVAECEAEIRLKLDTPVCFVHREADKVASLKPFYDLLEQHDPANVLLAEKYVPGTEKELSHNEQVMYNMVQGVAGFFGGEPTKADMDGINKAVTGAFDKFKS